MAAEIASKLVLNSDGSLKASPEQVIRTPSVIAILTLIFVLMILLVVGISIYWYALEAKNKMHLDSRYDVWYLSKNVAVGLTITAVVGVVLLVIIGIGVVFFLPGPLLAQAYMRDKSQRDLQRALAKEEAGL